MNRIRKMQTAAGGALRLTPEEQKYLEWSKLSPEQKQQRNLTIAKSYINSGPSISNYWNAAKAYFGGFNPSNPRQSTGAPTVLPGRMDNVILMEKEAPTMFRMLAENTKEMRKLLRESRGANGYVYRPIDLGEKIRKFLQSGDKSLLKELESWAVKNKNIFVKHKEATVTPKGNLSGPDNKIIDYTQRGLTQPKLMSDQQWSIGDGLEEFGGYIDRITPSIYRKRGGTLTINGIRINGLSNSNI